MMDRVIYNAAVEGNTDVITQNADQLEVQVTPQKNTVLHVAAQFGQTDCVKVILDKCGQSLLCLVNNEGDSSLHISSREGYANVVRQLIKYAKKDTDVETGTRTTKEMLRMRNVEGDTALHEAVRKRNNLNVVEILTREDSEFEHPPNNAEETPLFLAAERGDSKIVSKLLENRMSTYSGPNGRTALHATTIHRHKECIRILCDWKPALTKEADVYGWRPLHYAAWHYYPSMVIELLELDESVAYLVANEDDNKTALHVAVSQGNVEVMKKILSRCPDCWEMINTRGQNILHIAVEHDEEETVKFILENPFGKKLINQKDTDGNTPLHIAAVANHSIYRKYRKLFNQLWDEKACNKKNLTVEEIQYPGWLGAPEGSRNKFKVPKKEESPKGRNKFKQEFTKLADTTLIVAGLIATVTFTVGFTVPGGFESNDGINKGMAVLGRRAAFIAFAVTDTIAMLLSIIAVFLILISVTYTDEDEEKRIKRQLSASWLILAALGAMVVAYMTGFYATLEPSLGLAITICLICCIFFPISLFVFFKRILEHLQR